MTEPSPDGNVTGLLCRALLKTKEPFNFANTHFSFSFFFLLLSYLHLFFPFPPPPPHLTLRRFMHFRFSLPCNNFSP